MRMISKCRYKGYTNVITLNGSKYHERVTIEIHFEYKYWI